MYAPGTPGLDVLLGVCDLWTSPMPPYSGTVLVVMPFTPRVVTPHEGGDLLPKWYSVPMFVCYAPSLCGVYDLDFCVFVRPGFQYVLV